MTDLCQDGDEQQDETEDEGICKGVIGHGHHGDTAQTDHDTDHVDETDAFLEEDTAGRNGKDRRGRDDLGAECRRFRQFDAMGFTDEIDERFKEGQQQKIPDVLLVDMDTVSPDQVIDQQDQAGEQDSDKNEELDRDVETDQFITPEIGHAPEDNRQQGYQVYFDRGSLLRSVCHIHFLKPQKVTFL